ncbi:hypothetical protein [Micromonospora pisi]|uniref:hypothetical protein n=1 Tax=Micromonospora pisi TaxID=589240 RepID=UPI0011C43E22|nr:hypothetical protein [Micromonospora pisi]
MATAGGGEQRPPEGVDLPVRGLMIDDFLDTARTRPADPHGFGHAGPHCPADVPAGTAHRFPVSRCGPVSRSSASLDRLP